MSKLINISNDKITKISPEKNVFHNKGLYLYEEAKDAMLTEWTDVGNAPNSDFY